MRIRAQLLVIGLAATGLAASAVAAAGQSVPGQVNVHVTVILQNGQRYDGHNLEYRLDRPQMRIRTDAGVDESVPVDQVLFVEFIAGSPDLNPQQIGNVGPTAQTMQKHDGTIEHGRAIQFGHTTPGDETSQYLVIFKPDNGNEERLDWSLVNRVYFANPSAAIATSGALQNPVTIAVPANQPWVSTGVTVTQGQTVRFMATGQVRVRNGSMTTGPSGQIRLRQATSPMPNVPVGGLLGRIGNGPAFAIGTLSSVVMPGTGPLFLGVNDAQLQGNSGQFTVTLQPAARR